MADHCLFCGMVDGTVSYSRVVAEDNVLAFMDINPASDGHLLVIPKRHSKDLLDIPAADLAAVTLTAQRIAKAAANVLDVDGFNLLNCCGADAWQSVFHFHLHLVPRYRDESKERLTPPWQPGVRGDRETITAIASELSAALS